MRANEAVRFEGSEGISWPIGPSSTAQRWSFEAEQERKAEDADLGSPCRAAPH